MTTLQTAEVLPYGESRVSIAGGVYPLPFKGAPLKIFETGQGNQHLYYYLFYEAEIRLGLFNHLDGGVRLNLPLGLRADLKYQFLHREWGDVATGIEGGAGGTGMDLGGKSSDFPVDEHLDQPKSPPPYFTIVSAALPVYLSFPMGVNLTPYFSEKYRWSSAAENGKFSSPHQNYTTLEATLGCRILERKRNYIFVELSWIHYFKAPANGFQLAGAYSIPTDILFGKGNDN